MILKDSAGNGISIHAPRVGSDSYFDKNGEPIHISIHAPRVGSDIKTAKTPSNLPYFNPRSPCGERPTLVGIIFPSFLFQSTLPVWGAT